jgi:hypothetical protein
MAKVSSTSTTSTSVAPTGQPITARELRQLLHGRSNRFRATVAANLVTGNLRPERPSPVQAARLCDVNVGYVTVALGITRKRSPSDETIDRVVEKFGIEALMRGCDRATAPNGNGAAA